MFQRKQGTTVERSASPEVLPHHEGELHIFNLAGGRRRIELVPHGPGVYLPKATCETTYPNELIAQFLSVIGFNWLCDSIARDEEPAHVQKALEVGIFSFVPKEQFRGRRLLDFGCGSGASTAILGRLLPETRIIGIDLQAPLLALAEARARHHGLRNVRFLASPSGSALPEGLAGFDFILFSAVYEHLLPHEREELMPAIWAALAPGGVLFINQTPHRYFPIDLHSTGLPFVSYLPDRLAHWAAVHFARYKSNVNKSPHWETHLRGGIRGGTERQIFRNLCRRPAGADSNSAITEAVILEPCLEGIRDRVDLWFHSLNPVRYRRTKGVARIVLKLIYLVFGTVLSPNLTLAIRKKKV
jgi:2-polyprenyl-3-methyl-5-hydroxy-6-metoxy-1,4-benzoquinol methylase